MIGLGSPVLGLEPVSYVCHQEAAVIRHVIRGWVKEKEKKRERSSREVAFAFRKGSSRGGRGEKAFSIDEYFFYSGFGDSRIVFSREKEFERNFRCKT